MGEQQEDISVTKAAESQVDLKTLLIGIAIIILPILLAAAAPEFAATLGLPLRLITAIGGAVAGAALPGVLHIEFPGVRGVGALGLFALVLLVDPPNYLMSPNHNPAEESGSELVRVPLNYVSGQSEYIFEDGVVTLPEKIATNGNPIRIEAAAIISSNTRITGFSAEAIGKAGNAGKPGDHGSAGASGSSAAGAGGSDGSSGEEGAPGRNGSDITLIAEKFQGVLTIDANGERGGAGGSGGIGGNGGKGGSGRNGASGPFDCRRGPRSGGNGGGAGHGGDGADGGVGGDGGQVTLTFGDVHAGSRIRVSNAAGSGGEGGEGGEPGIPGGGGPRGSAPGLCSAGGAKSGSTGPAGNMGQDGGDGQSGSAGQTVLSVDGEVQLGAGALEKQF